MRCSLVVVFLSLFACAAPDGLEVSFDPCEPLGIAPTGEMSPAEAASIVEAVEMWRLAGAAIEIDRERVVDPSLMVRFDDAAPIFYGIYFGESGEIVINHRLGDDGRRITIAHELGHAFGLAHVESGDRVSLMNPGNLDVGITPGDVAELTRVWGECL